MFKMFRIDNGNYFKSIGNDTFIKFSLKKKKKNVKYHIYSFPFNVDHFFTCFLLTYCPKLYFTLNPQ